MDSPPSERAHPIRSRRASPERNYQPYLQDAGDIEIFDGPDERPPVIQRGGITTPDIQQMMNRLQRRVGVASEDELSEDSLVEEDLDNLLDHRFSHGKDALGGLQLDKKLIF